MFFDYIYKKIIFYNLVLYVVEHINSIMSSNHYKKYKETIKEVTKDRWDTTSTFSASFVKNALQDSANALNFLHSKVGISHGDFYAHNMKVDKATGRVYLLDFGASYFKGEYTLKAEKLEIRAFGVLVTELIEVMDPQESLLREKLITLYKKCINEDVSARPTFSEIEEIVKTL